jgi:hypothetical protein
LDLRDKFIVLVLGRLFGVKRMRVGIKSIKEHRVSNLAGL